jgi:hypothetical protein
MSTVEEDFRKNAQTAMDRLDIIDLFTRYAHAVDLCDWDLLRTAFSDDIQADYSSDDLISNHHTKLNGIDDLVHFFETVQPAIGPGLTIYMANHLIKLDGDSATITVYAQVLNLPIGSVYHAHARRTEKGWRLDRFVFENRYYAGVSNKMRAHMKME